MQIFIANKTNNIYKLKSISLGQKYRLKNKIKYDRSISEYQFLLKSFEHCRLLSKRYF